MLNWVSISGGHGSNHGWLEERGPWLILLLAMDDATGTAPYPLFREREGTRGYLSLLQGFIEFKGTDAPISADMSYNGQTSPSDSQSG